MVRILLVSFGSEWHNDVWNVLAIESLVGDLEGYFGNNIQISTFRFYTEDDIDSMFSDNNLLDYHLIGCSVEIGTHKILDYFLIKLFQNGYSNNLVLGGILATYAYDYLINIQSVKILKPIFIIGEGEIALRNLVNCIINNSINLYESEPNTFQYNNKVSKYVMNEVVTVDLSLLQYSPKPIVYSNSVNSIRIIQTSRNCVFNCTYCSQGPKKMWRTFSYKRIKGDLEIFIKAGTLEFEFVDDEFFGGNEVYNIDRAWKICDIIEELIRKYNCNIKFRIFTNPHIISSKNVGTNNIDFVSILNRLKDLGLSRVYLGVESGSLKQRKRYNRSDTIEECLSAITILENLNIEVDVGFIMFDPEVTLEDISDNIDFIQKNNLLKYNTWPLRPMILTAHTPMYIRAQKLGLITKRNQYNIASFEYVYQNFEIAMIYERINSIADSTAKVFYILKYIYKNNFYNSSYIDEVKDICMFLIENATINFDCIKNMIMHFNSGNNLITNLNEDTRNAFFFFFWLLDLIEEKSNSFKLFDSIYDKLNDAIVQSKESIAKEINQFN